MTQRRFGTLLAPNLDPLPPLSTDAAAVGWVPLGWELSSRRATGFRQHDRCKGLPFPEVAAMTTSSDHQPTATVPTHGDHWLSLTGTLCRESTDAFGVWVSDELAVMERKLDRFSTASSLRKSFARQSDRQ